MGLVRTYRARGQPPVLQGRPQRTVWRPFCCLRTSIFPSAICLWPGVGAQRRRGREREKGRGGRGQRGRGASLLHPPCGALLVMLLLVVSAPSLLALSHPPPLDQPHQQGVGSKGWASGFPLPLHQENVQGWINNVCCRHSIEGGPL